MGWCQAVIVWGFSPHTRGCSRVQNGFRRVPWVFPAYAGMFPWVRAVRNATLSFPRIRGDVPSELKPEMWPNAFSPHTRGCSWVMTPTGVQVPVFPAYAGMFRFGALGSIATSRFPRIRGDVPLGGSIGSKQPPFSPHTRGCSGLRLLKPFTRWVFPAYAGMFRNIPTPCAAAPGFPRIRGDVPGDYRIH